jgi:hypothetical protein
MLAKNNYRSFIILNKQTLNQIMGKVFLKKPSFLDLTITFYPNTIKFRSIVAPSEFYSKAVLK